MQEKRSFFDGITDFTMKIAEPMGRFAEKPWVSALQGGMIAIMPIVIIGSLFMVLGALGQPWIGDSGQPLLPFLAPYAGKILNVFRFTMNFLGLYAAVTIAMSYAEKLDVDPKAAGLLSLATFFLMTQSGTSITGVVKDAAGADVAFSVAGIPVSSFSASGLFTAIIVGLLSVRIYKFIVDKKITIRMPDSVPPNIGNAFTSLIPYAVVLTIAWVIRTMLGFDLATWVTTLLLPIFNAADNIVMYTIRMTLGNLLWSAGLHGDNMLNPVIAPFLTQWVADNAAALEAGKVLPHIWTGQLERMNGWTATVWPLLILLFQSKVPHHRTFAFAALPAAVFTIIEPVMFGLPLALNPMLIIPFLLSTVVSSIFTYGAVLVGFVGKFFAALPWATPPFILGPAASGDWKWIIVIAINVVIGYVIFLPFFKVYEKKELEKIALREAEKLAK